MENRLYQSAMKLVNPVERVFEKYGKTVINNDIVKIVVQVLVIISVILNISLLPEGARGVILHPATSAFIIFSSIYILTQNFKTSFVLTIVISLLINYFRTSKNEGFISMHNTDAIPRCSDVTKRDLVELFDGDMEALKKAMYESGVPMNVNLNDTNAPLIATYLINLGVKVSEQCRV